MSTRIPFDNDENIGDRAVGAFRMTCLMLKYGPDFVPTNKRTISQNSHCHKLVFFSFHFCGRWAWMDLSFYIFFSRCLLDR